MKKPSILVADSEPQSRRAYLAGFEALNAAEPHFVADAAEAIERLGGESFDLFVVAIGETASDISVVSKARRIDPELPVIVIVNRPTVETAAASLRLGAGDYLSKPLEPKLLAAGARRLLSARRMGAEYELLRRQVEKPYSFDDIIGGCPSMRKVFETIEQVAGSDVDVLVVGETGTGKELVARSLHRRSRRSGAPFVPVDCGAIPESLVESELFGHEKGAFTGADNRRIGLLEFADHGTFFLDELGELPLLMQAKLLRTLQERKIRRVGGREEIEVDVRIVAATARQLDEMIRQERFRQDLFYRINVVRIDLPPLRERGDDIGLLAEYMANRYAREMQTGVRGITPEAYQVLRQYRWPGNVRELQNVIRRGIALSRGTMIGLDDLPDELVAAAGEHKVAGEMSYFERRDQRIDEFEQQYLRELLTRHQGEVRTAAEEAKLPRGTLYRLMKKHELDGSEFR